MYDTNSWPRIFFQKIDKIHQRQNKNKKKYNKKNIFETYLLINRYVYNKILSKVKKKKF